MTVLAAIPPAADDPERLHRLLDDSPASMRYMLDRSDGSAPGVSAPRASSPCSARRRACRQRRRKRSARRARARPLRRRSRPTGGARTGHKHVVELRTSNFANVGGVRLDQRPAALRPRPAPPGARAEPADGRSSPTRARRSTAPREEGRAPTWSQPSASQESARPRYGPRTRACAQKQGQQSTSPAASPTSRASPSSFCSTPFRRPDPGAGARGGSDAN